MLRITRDVWEGHDYVPYVWQDWLRDGYGYLSVAEIDREVVGLMHTTVQGDGTAWMEGIRVQGDIQARGVGLALLEDGIAWVRAAGLPRLRLATYGGNPASNRLAVKAGLEEIARLRSLSGEPAEVASGDAVCRPALASDLDAVWTFLEHSRGPESSRLIYTEGWTAYSLTRQRLTLLLGTHAVLVAGASDAEGVAIATLRPERPVLRLGLVEGTSSVKESLVRAVVGYAERSGVRRIGATLDVDRGLLRILGDVGLSSTEVNEMIVYELELGDEDEDRVRQLGRCP